jgi:8-oxo-dGTP pyrophosphatase MutT (NUDIX family)
VSLRTDALEVLGRWQAPNAEQEALRQRYVRHLTAHEDGTWRSCYPEHLTAGALVISADGDRVLLNLHRKARRWFHFGGHCEPGDTTLAGAAAREAAEESGVAELVLSPTPVQLDEHVVSFCGDMPATHHLDVRYLAVAPADARETVSEESLAVRWWPVDALPDLEPAMHALIARARAWVTEGHVGAPGLSPHPPVR